MLESFLNWLQNNLSLVLSFPLMIFFFIIFNVLKYKFDVTKISEPVNKESHRKKITGKKENPFRPFLWLILKLVLVFAFAYSIIFGIKLLNLNPGYAFLIFGIIISILLASIILGYGENFLGLGIISPLIKFRAFLTGFIAIFFGGAYFFFFETKFWGIILIGSGIQILFWSIGLTMELLGNNPSYSEVAEKSD